VNTIREPARDIPVAAEVEIAVVGGGPGGLTAAIAAAREGANVLLIERYGFLGGLATAGLIGPIYGYSAAQSPELILGGIPVEIIDRMDDLSCIKQPINWRAVVFEPEAFKYVSDRLVEESNVKLMFHTLATNAIVEGERVKAVIVENKSGRQAIIADMVIDATGDADIAAFSGVPFHKGRKIDGLTECMGTKFRIGGVEQLKGEELKKAREMVSKDIGEGKIYAFHNGLGEGGASVRPNEITPTVTRCKGDGTKVEDLTRAELECRRDSWDIVKYYRENVPGYESCYIIATPGQIGVRETRQIAGEYTLTAEDVLSARKFGDTIARGSWFIDIHCPLGRVGPRTWVCSKNCKIEPPCDVRKNHPDQLLDNLYVKTGDWYDIPYRCLIPEKMDNLIISGRCISATHAAMASLRVMGTCMAIGQAAGTAAFLSIGKGIVPRNLNVQELQAALEERGINLSH